MAVSWSSLLQPDLILGDTVASLTPELLEAHQLQGLILDVDETLVSTTEREIPLQVRQWIARARAGRVVVSQQ